MARSAPLRRKARKGRDDDGRDEGRGTAPDGPSAAGEASVTEGDAGDGTDPAGETGTSATTSETTSGNDTTSANTETTSTDPPESSAAPEEVEQTLSYRERRRRRATGGGAGGVAAPTAPTGNGVRYRGRRTRPRIGLLVGVGLCVIVLIGAIVASVVFAIGLNRDEQRRADRAEYSAFAQQTIVDLTSMNPDNVDSVLKTLQDKTSGKVQQQLKQSTEQVVSLVREQNLETKSTVLSSAVTDATPDEGTVILVSGWQMRPPDPKEEMQVQTLRWRLQVTRINGDLKLTSVEWVA
ncbi:hypothetical protein GCM10009624_00150 [Gordonia sinesedis]